MRKVLTIFVVVLLAMVGTTMGALLDINAPMTFTGIIDLAFPYYPPDLTGTQNGTMLSDDDSDYSLFITTADPGPTGAEMVISWDIRNTVNNTSLLNGTMENFIFWDENNNIPSGTSGSVFSSADYVTSGAWQGVGDSTGSWLGTYDATPQWTGTVVITPEPTTLCLLGLGGLLLRRKK